MGFRVQGFGFGGSTPGQLLFFQSTSKLYASRLFGGRPLLLGCVLIVYASPVDYVSLTSQRDSAPG